MQNIYHTFVQTAERFPGKPALKYKHQGTYVPISFFDLKNSVDQLALGLLALGLKKGDRFAMLSENKPEWVKFDLALAAIGGVNVAIHTTLSPTIIKHIVKDSGSKIIFVSNQEQYNKLLLIKDELDGLEIIIYLSLDHQEENTINDKKMISFSEVMNLGLSDKKLIPETDLDLVASLIYTSGTTAMPKGVMLTHRNLIFDAQAGVVALPCDEKDTMLSFLPLTHALERTAGYLAPMVCRGSCLAFAESIKTLSENLKEVRPTILVCVPRIFEKVHVSIWDKVKNGGKLKYNIFIWALKQEPGTVRHFLADQLVFKKIRANFGGRLRFAISGGASLNHKLARFFARLGIKITEGYGLTETAPIISVNRLDNIKYGTVGQQLPGVEIKIAKDKEILARGPNLMKGYYQNPELTAEVIDSDGWFHTGDLGHLSSEGFLVIIGRKKEMISLANGKIAWPEQIELLINNDRLITQSIVLGDGKSYLTTLLVPDWAEVLRSLEEIKIVSAEPSVLVNNQKLIDFFAKRIENINDQLADWEKIRKFALLVDEFTQEKDELTPTLKLRRHIILEHYQKVIQSLY